MNPWQWMQMVSGAPTDAAYAPRPEVGMSLLSTPPAPVPAAALKHDMDPTTTAMLVPPYDAASLELQVMGDEPCDTESVMMRPRHATTIEIPLRLAWPLIEAPTNPYVDLPRHLRHYGLEAEALEFARSHATCDFVLEAFLTMHKLPRQEASGASLVSQAGEELLHALEQALRAREPSVQEQLACTAMAVAAVPPEHVALPPSVCLPWTNGMRSLPMPAMPTHILAVCASTMSTEFGHWASTPCTLVPVHWIVYVLQCTQLPAVPAQAAAAAASQGQVPLVPLAVPYPQHWAILHRWLYTRDMAKLLASLVPLSAVLQYVHGHGTEGLSASAPLDALACVSLSVLVRLALRIRATWHNAQSVGIIAEAFWTTLARAWDMVVHAMVLRKARVPPRVVPASA